MQQPVYLPSGKLLGVGGIDILISTVGDLLAKVKYRDEGDAFLVTDDGTFVFFPDPDDLLAIDATLADVARHVPESAGFDGLLTEMHGKRKGLGEVTWRGETRLVAFQEVSGKSPDYTWYLGLMVPRSLIDAPVQKAAAGGVTVILCTLFMIGVVIALSTRAAIKPLRRVVAAMEEIAAGDGNLSRRLKVTGDDEAGRLAAGFNAFAERIQELVAQTAVTSTGVKETAHRVSGLSREADEGAGAQQESIDRVAAATLQIVEAVRHASDIAERARASAQHADGRAVAGRDAMAAATEHISSMSQRIRQAASGIGQLKDDSNRIASVLDTIRSIANQTNLLALNAAVEAARAGKHGQGFAVVAEEVRNLAGRTQRATDDIQQIISEFLAHTNSAAKEMDLGNREADETEAQTRRATDVLQEIAAVITEIQAQAEQIVTAAGEQYQSAAAVSGDITDLRRLADRTATGARAVRQDSEQLAAASNQLAVMVGRFQI
jgi:methyl-accepting chemotaxis protein